ncbi:MAG: isocitrate lyase, partial [Kaistella sp.]|nr:isocitrate lyase [Kaistella sp.]
MKNQEQIRQLEQDWQENPRWNGVERPYSAEEVLKLRGSYQLDYTIAKMMSEKLWEKLNSQDFVAGLGALTGNQAVQEVDAGLEAIY